MMKPAIQARFHMSFADFRLDTDLTLPSSGVTALFGHSGSGKTTLLRCIAGLERAPDGFCSVNGTVWQDSQRGIFLPTHQRPLGYVFQEASLFPHLTVRRNLEFGQKRIPAAQRRVALEQALHLLGIEHLLERMPEKLSGGEKQRVAIARALAVSPQILLMDEPLAALDLKRKQEILPFLTRLHQELDMPIVYVTHSPEEVAQLADYLVVMEAGKVVTAGTLDETLTRLDSPLAQGQQAASVLNVTITAHEPDYHLTHTQFAGGTLSLPYLPEMAIGSALRVRISARDVSLSVQQPTHTSILNVLPATITALAHDNAGQTLVRLALNDTPLLAHITYKSAVQLALITGMTVYVQIKATAIL